MNTPLSLTDIIALIGCITGVSSLVLNVRKIWVERFSLKVHFCEDRNLYFYRLEECQSYKTKLQGILSVRLENRSALPITIHTLKIYIDDTNISFQKFSGDSFSLTTNLFPNGGKRWTVFSMSKQIVLPLRLNPYDAYEGIIFLPYFPSTEKISSSVKLRIETTKGKRTYFSRIWNGNTVVNDGDGPYIQ